MRRLLVAGFAALAVLLGLVATTGVASAAPPVGCTDHDATTACTWPTHVPHPGGAGDHHFPGGGPLGGGWRPGANIPWGGPTLYGHQLWLQANLGLDICGYGNSYDTFIGRNSVHRSDIDRYLGRARWQTLYSSDCNSGLAVVPNGLSLVNGNLLNLSLLGLSGAGTVDVCDYPDYNVFSSRYGGRFGNRWDSVRNHFGSNGFNIYRQLRVNARCTTVMVPSSTTIVQQPAQTLEAAPSTDPAPAVTPSADDGASKPMASGPVPSGAVQTGGDSIGFVLAHNRAV